MINWATYPPAAHEPRIKDYGRFEGLFLAQHQTIFKVKTGGPFQMSRYIVANFAGILSTLSADMLFGEPPDYLVTDEANTGAADAVERLVGQNGLRVLSYEAALASSFRGDAVLKVRWGIRNPVDPEAEPEIPEPKPGTAIDDRPSLQDRPTAAELLEAVREFLEHDVADATEGRTAFHARVAVNALGIVERELVLGPSVDAPVLDRLTRLLGHSGTPDELVAELAARIRDGSLDDRPDEVVKTVRDLVRAKLAVANPRYR